MWNFTALMILLFVVVWFACCFMRCKSPLRLLVALQVTEESSSEEESDEEEEAAQVS